MLHSGFSRAGDRGRRSSTALRAGATRAVLPFVIGSLVPLIAPAGAPAAERCAFADAPVDAVGVTRSTAALRCLIDHERTAAGLPAFGVDGRMNLAARRHAADMGRRGFFGDVAPDPSPHGATVAERLQAVEYAPALFSENIARSQPTARALVRDWLAVRGACSNLMSRPFTDAGVGAILDRGEPFWVLVLARPAGLPASAGPVADCPRLPAVPAPSGRPGPGKVTAKRTRRMLAVSVTIPPEIGRSTLVVRVQLRGRTVRTLRRRTDPGTRRFAVRLPAATSGRVVAQAGPAARTAVAFR